MAEKPGRTPSDVLREILADWPKKSDSVDMDAFKLRLAPYLAAGFNSSGFSNRPFGEFSILSNELVVGDTAKILVYDSADPQYPNLAVLSLSHGKWYLKKFLFQCASCFGTGVLGTDPCDTCGATGWGLINWSRHETDL